VALELGLIAAGFLAAFAGSLALHRYALARDLLDVPNPRSSHDRPTPRGGGLAIVTSFLTGLTVLLALGKVAPGLYAALALGGSAVAAIGFRDDHVPVSARARVLVHTLAAGWALYCLGGWARLDLGVSSLEWGLLGAVVGTVGLVWLLNLYNFMDGIDGIAFAEAVAVASGGCLLLWQAGAGTPWGLALLAASSLGFGLLNWPPARLFMGDVGSGFLGYALGVFALDAITRGVTAPWPWFILLGVFAVDATVTLARRVATGQRWHQAHRTHAYQRAARRYGGHRPVTLAVVALDLAWLLPLALAADRWPVWAVPLTVLALAPLVALALWLGAGLAEDDPPAR
jgi:Fuc2NAc and GlcNAc transferase